MLTAISGNTGFAVSHVTAAVKGFQNQIRKLPPVDAKLLIQRTLSEVAKEYGARDDVPPGILFECVRLIGTKFAFLGVDEIREAYRQWAAGEIEAKGAEMYGGQFNAAQLGKVLSAYSENRKKIVSEYVTASMKAKEELESAKRQEKQRAWYEDNFDMLLQSCRAEDWREIPHHWFDTAWRRKMFNMSAEQIEEIKRDADELAQMEIETELEETADKYKRKNLQAYIEAGGTVDRARVIAKKIAVFRFIILPLRVNESKRNSDDGGLPF